MKKQGSYPNWDIPVYFNTLKNNQNLELREGR